MKDKKDRISKLRESFKPTMRGRLLREREFSLKSLYLMFVMVFVTLLVISISYVIIASIENIKEPNLQLSVVVAIVIALQLIFFIIQIFTQHITDRYTRIEYMPNISVEVKDIEKKLGRRGRNTQITSYLIVRNTSRDAHNVSVAIKSNKKLFYSKRPLFFLRNNSVRAILKIGDKEAFKRARIDVFVIFEDIIEILHKAHFIKYEDADEFITKETGL